jgi:hypothetical protein
MKIDPTAILTKLNGEPHKVIDTASGVSGDKDLTLKDAIVNALTAIYQDEKPEGVESFKRGQLASVIYKATGEIEVTAEDVALMKKLLGRYYGPAVIYPAYMLLEKGE